jgi:phospholipid/cholesterol/gamma-HCH transport system substrate-binding protein
MTMLDPRERMTEGVTRERLRMEARRSLRPTLIFGLGLIVTVAIVAFLIAQISATFGHKTRTVRFAAPTAFGVFEGFDEVRYRGVPAGTISKIERRGSQIVLVAKIRRQYGPIFRDARAELRPTTPLNDEFLDIVDQGHASAGEADPDEPLSRSQLKTSVSVPEVFDTFKADERAAFTKLLDQLGNGTADRGAALRAAFVQLVPFLQGAGELTRAVAVRRTATKRLVHNASILTDELGNREVALRRLVRSGAATLGTLQQGAGDLDRTLAELGPTFTELRDSLASVRGVLGDVDAGLRSLNPVADRLPGGLTAVRALNRDLVPTLRSLRTGIPPMTELVVSATTVLRNLTGAADALQPQVPVLSKLTRDLATCERGVIGFMHWNASLSKFGDWNGPVPRGNVVAGVPAISSSSPLREPHKGCTPGMPQRGVITAEDER